MTYEEVLLEITDELKYIDEIMSLPLFPKNNMEIYTRKKEKYEVIKDALEKQNKLQVALDIVDKEALNLQVKDFPEGCEYFRGFRAGMCQAVERIDDLANGKRGE